MYDGQCETRELSLYITESNNAIQGHPELLK